MHVCTCIYMYIENIMDMILPIHVHDSFVTMEYNVESQQEDVPRIVEESHF